jgi:enoyl-CoA hydratase/carnithine racemase
MAYATITATIEDGIGRLVLNQPKKLNPLGTNTLRDIIDATTWFNNENASVVIISGKGRAFTSGFDLREFSNKQQVETVQFLEEKWLTQSTG